MPIRGEDGLFGALEAELKKAKEPMDCVALFEKSSIRAHAINSNWVSDYLGNMWRKGLVLRLPAPKTGTVGPRWMYVWKNRAAPAKPSIDQAVEFNAVKNLFSKPNIEITEEGDTAIITLPSWSITIKKN